MKLSEMVPSWQHIFVVTRCIHPNVTLAYDDDKQYEAHKCIKATMSKSFTFEIDTHLL